MLYVFYQTLDENKPKWQLDNGLIGANPGLGFRPMPPESNVESTLVWFEAANTKNTEYWIGALDEFLECKILSSPFIDLFYILIDNGWLFFAAYTKEDKEAEKNRVACDFTNPPQNGKVCRVDVSKERFGICSKERDYGYSKSSPCVFLKLNKVSFWCQFFNNKAINFIYFLRSTTGILFSTTNQVTCLIWCLMIWRKLSMIQLMIRM